MLTTGKRRVAAVVLMIAIMATMLVGYASATEAEAYAANSTAYGFWLSLPAYGVTDLATPRTKESSNSYAYYYLTTVTNTTGYDCYLNVRSGDGNSIAGYAKMLSNGETGYLKVYYRTSSGFGNVGSSYRPSGQTDNSSSKVAYIEGSWIP